MLLNLKKSTILTTIVILFLLLVNFTTLSYEHETSQTQNTMLSSSTSFDSPGPDPTGLTWQSGTNAWLWNADNNTKKIYKIVPQDGNIARTYDSPGSSPGGMTWDGQYIWNVDRTDERIYKMYPSNGTYAESIETPQEGSTGLTWDGSHLWLANNNDDKIYKLDSEDGTLLLSFDSPGSHPTGLAWDGQYLWNADRQDDLFYMIDPIEGDVIYSINSSGFGPWGITWQGNDLWNVDDLNDQIYRFNASYEDNQPPVAEFTWNPFYPAPGDLITFNASESYDPEENITSYNWDFNNDGEFDVSSNLTNTTKKWDNPGSYIVRLVVIDNKSFMDQQTKIITVQETHPPMVSIISPQEDDIVNKTVTIEGTATDLDDDIEKVEIKIDDGNWTTVNGKNTWQYYWHTYTNVIDGIHQISARSFNGLSYSKVKTVNVTVNNYHPRLLLDIKGGLMQFSIKIKNNGDEMAENLSVNITVFGGFLGLINLDDQESIPVIEVGESKEIIFDEPLSGFGPIDITIIIKGDNLSETVTTEIDAFMLGIFIIA